MVDFKNGMLVEHTSLGLGKVVALEENALHVFFEASEKRFATKLRLPVAGPMLSPATTKNSWLKGLSSFTLEPKTGRYGLTATWLTQSEAIARFTEVYPDGFVAPKLLANGKEKSERATKWRAATEMFAKTLGGGEGERLLAEKDIDELTKRAIRVERCVSTLHPTADRNAFKEALADPSTASEYFAALFEILAAPALEQQKFERLVSAVKAMPSSGSPGFDWQVTTLLLFIAQPDRYAVLRPKATCDAANRLGFSLSYQATPNWNTYSTLLSSARQLLGSIQSLGARDYIDVESFMHVITTKRASA